MKRFLVFLSVMVIVLGAVGGANAVPFTFGDGGASLQGVLNDFTLSPNPGVSSVDVTTDSLHDSADSYWQMTATGSSVSTVVIELAGLANSNTFGVYNGNSYVELFAGAASQGDSVTLGLLDNFDGTYSVEVNNVDTSVDWNSATFGYYLDTGPDLFHSDTSMNSDQTDHMVAFRGESDTVQIQGRSAGTWTPQEYVLAWEDNVNGGDNDYDDFVVMAESVNPVPEPTTMFLLGTGLIGLVGFRKKFRK